MAYLVTGRKGVPHVSSNDDAAFNRGVCGTGDYVLAGNQIKVRVEDGKVKFKQKAELCIAGKHCRIEGTEEVAIATTSQGMFRKDLIVGRYTANSDNTESFDIVLLQGQAASSASNAVLPSIASNDIYNSAGMRDMPLVEVLVEGSSSITATERNNQIPSLAGAKQSVDQAVTQATSKINNIGAYNDVPLAANKTISGGASTVVVSLTLPAGTYVLQGFVAWDKVSNGAVGRAGIMTRDEFANASNHFSERRNLLSTSGGTRMGVGDIMKLTATTEVCLAVYTSDKAVVLGNSVIHTTGLRAVRIV